jgi:hypothetical protein
MCVSWSHRARYKRTVVTIKEQSFNVDEQFAKEREVLTVELKVLVSIRTRAVRCRDLVLGTVDFPNNVRTSLINLSSWWMPSVALFLERDIRISQPYTQKDQDILHASPMLHPQPCT